MERRLWKRGAQELTMAISKVATGSAIMLAMADLAMSGQITGEGPSNWKQREQLKRTGWQPNSIKIENEDGSTSYYGVRGMEPFSTPIMLASNMVEILKESDIGDEDQGSRIGMGGGYNGRYKPSCIAAVYER